LKTAATISPELRRLLAPRVVLVLLVLAGYSTFALLPVMQSKLGLPLSGIWFLDSYAILAASDAVRAGLDPFAANPLDATQRQHSYSSWWFHVGDLGLTRQDNPLVGGLWAVAFLVAVFALLRPRTHAAAAWCALLVLSPPVMLAVVRANNDLVVFALLAAGVLVLRETAAWRLAFFAGLLVLATGLKFYPLVAGLTLLLVRPPRRMLTAGVITLLAGGATLLSVWGDLKRAVIPTPDGVYTFGAPIIFRDLGWTPPVAMGAGLGLLVVGAAVCWRRGWFIRLDDPSDDPVERLAFACGAAVLVGCFLAGISHAYRLIFALMLAPLLWQTSAGRRRWPVLLLLAAVWLDGLYCLAANLFIGPMRIHELLRLQWFWRLVSQPLIWVCLSLLAGTLLELVRSAWSDWRKESSRPPSP
jgi:hypothetical protein